MNANISTQPLSLAPIPPLTAYPNQPEEWHFQRRPLPFEAAAHTIFEAASRDGARRDIPTASLASWAFGSGDGRTMQLAAVPFAGREVPPPLALREHAFEQLAARIGAPASYMRELPPKLAMACMNYGLVHHDRPALLRIAGNSIRAIVSERYAALDDSIVLDVVDDTLRHLGLRQHAFVRAVAVGTTTVLRLTLPSEGVAVRPGDTVEFGIDIANGEIANRSLQITPVTVRLVCTNGMRATDSAASKRLRHVGDPTRLRDAFREAVPLALAEARGDIDRWKQSVDVLVDDALAEVESLRSFGATTNDVHAITRTLAATFSDARQPSAFDELAESMHRPTWLYDVSNAITATARERGTAARLDLEQLAHRHLMSRTR